MMDWNERLKQLREQENMSLSELAIKAGMSKSYLSTLESGNHKYPSAHILYRIAAVLGTTIADILGKSTGVEVTDYESLPAGLQELIATQSESLDIRDEDVRVLANIEYRGKTPKQADDYAYILQTLRLVTRQD